MDRPRVYCDHDRSHAHHLGAPAMTNATGEFPSVAASETVIRWKPSSLGKPAEGRQMLTVEAKPLPFTLEFSNGETLEVVLFGSGKEPSTIWHLVHSVQRLAQLGSGWDSYG